MARKRRRTFCYGRSGRHVAPLVREAFGRTDLARHNSSEPSRRLGLRTARAKAALGAIRPRRRCALNCRPPSGRCARSPIPARRSAAGWRGSAGRTASRQGDLCANSGAGCDEGGVILARGAGFQNERGSMRQCGCVVHNPIRIRSRSSPAVIVCAPTVPRRFPAVPGGGTGRPTGRPHT